MRHPTRNPERGESGLSCSFCKKSQDDIEKLITGPGVCICDECVRACAEIIADEPSVEGAIDADGANQASVVSSGTASCTMCGMPILLGEALSVENRALLCQPCVSAVQAAAAQAEDTR